MQITKLEIGKRQSYEENPGDLVGLVTLTGPTGSQSLVLAPASVSAIFRIVREDVLKRAKLNAMMAEQALDDAVALPLLQSSAGIALEA
jgi:hypothetical protein